MQPLPHAALWQRWPCGSLCEAGPKAGLKNTLAAKLHDKGLDLLRLQAESSKLTWPLQKGLQLQELVLPLRGVHAS